MESDKLLYCVGKSTVGCNEESWRDEAYVCHWTSRENTTVFSGYKMYIFCHISWLLSSLLLLPMIY